MQIISHRGYWKVSDEKNKINAFERSFKLGFGTETDIRDFNGELVISHDIPNSSIEQLIYVDDFFKLYKSIGNNLPLALNIKSDGLQEMLKNLIIKYDISNYFVFDMSIPDTLGYMKRDIKYFSRQSEFEIMPSLYKECKGVWLDEFVNHWITPEIIEEHLKINKLVCIVSPELHGRNNIQEWANYKNFITNQFSENLILCTDNPEDAKKYFYED
jgi:hypothetical protein